MGGLVFAAEAFEKIATLIFTKHTGKESKLIYFGIGFATIFVSRTVLYGGFLTLNFNYFNYMTHDAIKSHIETMK